MPTRTAPTTIDLPSNSPYQLDTAQVARASKALLRKLKDDEALKKTAGEKADLLADADAEQPSDAASVWLIVTTKKHIIDKRKLKPGKIALPHPYTKNDSADRVRVCLITADPQRKYKEIVAHPSFPTETSQLITRVIGLEKLKSKYNAYESKRQLLSEYDVFLADDRVITYLPALLGKVFYKSSTKRPIPVSLEGRRQNFDEQGNKRRKLAQGGTKVVKSEPKPTEIAAELEKALSSALVHLAPSTTTAIRVGTATMTARQIEENIEAVVPAFVETYVPSKWRNVRSIHVKGASTIALPIWMTTELWTDAQEDIHENLVPYGTAAAVRKRKARLLTDGDNQAESFEVPGADGKMRTINKPAKSTKPTRDTEAAAARHARKDSIKKQKAALIDDASLDHKRAAIEATLAQPAKKRMKAADLI